MEYLDGFTPFCWNSMKDQDSIDSAMHAFSANSPGDEFFNDVFSRDAHLVPTDNSTQPQTTLFGLGDPGDTYVDGVVEGVDVDLHANYTDHSQAAAPRFTEKMKHEYLNHGENSYFSPPQSPHETPSPKIPQTADCKSHPLRSMPDTPKYSPGNEGLNPRATLASPTRVSRTNTKERAGKSSRRTKVIRTVNVDDLQLPGISNKDASTIGRLFPGNALQLDRDGFKEWRSTTNVRKLNSDEEEALRKIRRRLLGRTYAKRSRERQVNNEQATVAHCHKLEAENKKLRNSIELMTQKIQQLSRC